MYYYTKPLERYSHVYLDEVKKIGVGLHLYSNKLLNTRKSNKGWKMLIFITLLFVETGTQKNTCVYDPGLKRIKYKTIVDSL